MKWADLIWGKVTLTVASVGLAISGLVGDPRKSWDLKGVFGQDRPWVFISGFAGFIVFHSIVSWAREPRVSKHLARNREAIQNNILHLISDLSSVSGREYDLWAIDLYLVRPTLSFSRHSPFIYKKILERKLRLSLTDVRSVPASFDLGHEFFGKCFNDCEIKLWWNSELAQTQVDTRNWKTHMSCSVNEELKETYGVIGVAPIADHLNQSCKGLLVVHTNNDSETATKALGALAGSEGIRFMSRTCQNLHNQLQNIHDQF